MAIQTLSIPLNAIIAQPIANKLYGFYSDNKGTCSGEIAPRVGYFLSGIVVEPLIGVFDGVIGVICVIFGAFAKMVCAEETGDQLYKASGYHFAGAARILSNMYAMLLKAINPEADIQDRYVEKNGKIYDNAGSFSTEIKDVFSRGIEACCLSESAFARQILSRIAVIFKVGIVIGMRLLDLASGIVIAAASVLSCGSRPSWNHYAYNALKIGAILTDITTFFEEIINPSKFGVKIGFGQFSKPEPFVADPAEMDMPESLDIENNKGDESLMLRDPPNISFQISEDQIGPRRDFSPISMLTTSETF